MLLALPTYAETQVGFKSGLGIASGDAQNGLSGLTPSLGLEFDFGISGNIELGAFMDYNFLFAGSSDSATGGHLLFYGALLRYYFPGALGVFADFLAGITQATQNEVSGDSAFGFGFRLGSKVKYSEKLNFLPFAGIRFLPYDTPAVSTTRTVFEFGLLVSVPLGGGTW